MQRINLNISIHKKRILAQFPDLMKGSISFTSRFCGKPTCKRCQRGEKHPVYNFAFSFKGGKKVVTIPPKFHKQVEKLIKNWRYHKQLLEELTDINVQLIKKGEFKE